jgi:signal peptidase I
MTTPGTDREELRITEEERAGRPFFRRLFVRVVIVAGCLYLAYFVVAKTFFPSYRIPGGSMSPAVHPGDSVITRRFEYRTMNGTKRRSPLRWEMVTYRSHGIRFMHRIAGLPGETVEIRGKRLIINGSEILDPFGRHTDDQLYPHNPALPEPFRSRDWFGPLTLAPKQFFVLGDNRDASSDSRFTGPVLEDEIIGKVFYVIHREKTAG